MINFSATSNEMILISSVLY